MRFSFIHHLVYMYASIPQYISSMAYSSFYITEIILVFIAHIIQSNFSIKHDIILLNIWTVHIIPCVEMLYYDILFNFSLPIYYAIDSSKYYLVLNSLS